MIVTFMIVVMTFVIMIMCWSLSHRTASFAAHICFVLQARRFLFAFRHLGGALHSSLLSHLNRCLCYGL